MTKSAYDKIAAGLSEALEVAARPTPRLTPAQRRALLWLPADGTERPLRADSATPRYDVLRRIRRLGLARKAGQNDGHALTPAGQAVREQIEREGQ